MQKSSALCFFSLQKDNARTYIPPHVQGHITDGGMIQGHHEERQHQLASFLHEHVVVDLAALDVCVLEAIGERQPCIQAQLWASGWMQVVFRISRRACHGKSDVRIGKRRPTRLGSRHLLAKPRHFVVSF